VSLYEDIREHHSTLDGFWSGRIANDVGGDDEPVYVVIPAFDNSFRFGPCKWSTKVQLLPRRGDECLVVFDEKQRPYVIDWWTDVGGGGEGVVVFEQPNQPTSTVTGAMWIDTDATPPAWAAQIPLVTSLPASPIDGQEIYYLADATNGIIWHLRYRASSSSAYKWEFVGGSSLLAETAADAGLTTTIAVIGPSLTLPLAGNYDFGFGARSWQANTAGASSNVWIYLNGSQIANIDNWQGSPGTSITLWAGHTMRRTRGTATASGWVADLRGSVSTGSGIASARWLEICPVRVG
jgi:hypothetical protein